MIRDRVLGITVNLESRGNTITQHAGPGAVRLQTFCVKGLSALDFRADVERDSGFGHKP